MKNKFYSNLTKFSCLRVPQTLASSVIVFVLVAMSFGANAQNITVLGGAGCPGVGSASVYTPAGPSYWTNSSGIELFRLSGIWFLADLNNTYASNTGGTASLPPAYGWTDANNCGTVTLTGAVFNNCSVNYSSGSVNQTVCAGDTITHIVYSTQGVTSVSGSPSNGLTATFSGGTLGGTITISGTPTASGGYSFTPIGNGCPSITGTMTVNPRDDASYSYPSTVYCANDTDPTPTITGVSGGTFSSTPTGLSLTAATGVVDLDASTPGTYTVTYLTNGSCPDSTSQSITITALDDASYSYPSTVYCANDTDPTPTITGVSGGTFSSTPTGLSLTAATGVVDLDASAPGTYTVTYLTNGSCPDSTSQSITITALDDASFSYPSTVYCANDTDPTPTITGVSGGTFSSTPTGLSLTAATGVVDLDASTPGTYTITYLTNGSCPDSTSQSITITALDDASFSYPTAVYCANDTDPTPTITGVSGGTFSSTPTGLSLTAASGLVDLDASTPGTYTVTYLTNGSCPDSSNQTVTINAVPVLTGSDTVCAGATSQLSTAQTSTPATTSPWVSSDTVVATVNNTGMVTALTVGTTTISYTDSNGCGADTLITVVGPTVTATATSPSVCMGDSTTLTGGGAVSYAWDMGVMDGVAFAPSSTATYTVTGTDANSCSATATIEVTVIPLPGLTLSAMPSAAVCPGDSVQLNASPQFSNNAGTILWSPAAGLSNVNILTPIANPMLTTTYVATVTDSVTACISSDSVQVVAAPDGDLTQSTGGNATSTSGSSCDLFVQPNDGLMYSYYDQSCKLIASIQEAAGGLALGNVSTCATIDAAVPFHQGQPYVARYFEITPTNQTSADVTFYLTQDDFDDYNTAATANGWPLLPVDSADAAGIANLRITKNDNAGLGVNPVVLSPSSVLWDSPNQRWSITFNTPGFSQFRLHTVNPQNIPLSLHYKNFRVTKKASADLVEWTTISEENNSHFNVQRSNDGTVFKTIGIVNTKAMNGTSTKDLEYSFLDTDPQEGHNFYRFEQVDKNMRTSLSEVIDIIWGAAGSVLSIYPNPTNNILNIDVSTLSTEGDAVLDIKLLDMSGRVVKSVSMQANTGLNTIKMDLSKIANGVYHIQIFEDNVVTHISKVSKKN